MKAAFFFLTMLAYASGAFAGLGTSATDFRPVAKTAIPAVVSIQVKGVSTPAEFSDDEEESGSANDFWERFFALPRGREAEQKFEGQASGFLISSDGEILTNSHVVKGMSEIKVILNNGKEYPAKVLGQDPNTDVAVIKIEAKELPYLQLGNSDQLEVGEPVAAIGNPMGLQATMTAGIVSAKGRNNLDLSRVEDYIQTDAAINRGNSGGPLLDMNSRVVGMNTAIVTSMAHGGYMGIGFAIPSNLLKKVADDLKDGGTFKRGYLGVLLQQVDDDLAQAFHMKKTEGVVVAEVQKDSPGAKGGLKRGDVILSLNNQPVTTVAALRNAIALMKPGAEIVLSILREGSPMQLKLELGLFPSSETAAVEKNPTLGIEVSSLTPELAEKLGYQDLSGVVVTQVDPRSPLVFSGIKKGALIQEINNQKIASVEEFNSLIKQTVNGQPILFLIKQGELTRYVSIKVLNAR
jgi:serine protease Do